MCRKRRHDTGMLMITDIVFIMAFLIILPIIIPVILYYRKARQ